MLDSFKSTAIKLMSVFIVVEGISPCPLDSSKLRVCLINVDLEATPQCAFFFVLFASLDSSVVSLARLSVGFPLLISSGLLLLLKNGVETDFKATGIWDLKLG